MFDSSVEPSRAMPFRAGQLRRILPLLLAAVCTTVNAAGPAPATLPTDFLDRCVTTPETLRLTLPNGQQVVGKIARLQRSTAGVTTAAGAVQHPEPGVFAFARLQTAGTADKLSGYLRLASKPTEWNIREEPVGTFRLVEVPAEDAFRPRQMVMPTPATPPQPSPAMIRAAAEASLRNDLKIEQIAPGHLRIGRVELDQTSRSIRFPATLILRDGPVEYAVVASTGKVHEALFATLAAPRDIHLAMVLLGVKPTPCPAPTAHALTIPPAATVRVTVEWDADGSKQSHPLAALVATADQALRTPLTDRDWLYNGSRFTDAGFGAALEGSIVSLIADDMALINNSGADRSNDDSHVPNANLLPKTGTPLTIVIAPPLPASIQKPTTAAP